MNLWQRIAAGASAAIKSFVDVVTGRTEELEPEPQPQPEPQPDPRIERLKAENRYLIDQANQKYDELISQDLEKYSSAFEKAQDSGGRFDIEDLDGVVSINREVLRATEFINDPTSDINVASAQKRREIGSETVKELESSGIDLFRTRVHEDNVVKEFWEQVDRVREEENIGARLQALNYAKEEAYGYAFNIWVDSGFDQKVLRNELDKIASGIEAAHLATQKAVEGTATFMRQGDDFT